MMKIGLANDHGAYEYKEILKAHLIELGHEVVDYGTMDTKSVDYPDYAVKACLGINNHECDTAILMCGSGIGISIAANKIKGIRCALCTDSLMAKLAREHNNSNVLAMGARIIGVDMMKEIADTYLSTAFSEGKRHIARILKISELDK